MTPDSAEGNAAVLPAHEKAEIAPTPRTVFPVMARWAAPCLAWLFPGLGHWYLGKRGKALVFFVLIVCALAIGFSLDGKIYKPERGNAFALLGSYACLGLGPGYFVLRRFEFARGDLLSPTNEYGNRFILTGGLMNLLLLLDAYDIAAGRKKKPLTKDA